MSDRAFLEQFRLTPEGQKLLAVLRYAEGTSKYEDPYSVFFGGGRIPRLDRHPDRVIRTRGSKRGSSAAGAYQFLTPTWNQRAQKLGLRDFGPVNQDIAALDLARNRLRDLGGLAYIQQRGLTREALAAMAPEWASLPTMAGRSYYGQPVKSAAELQKVYQQYTSKPPAQQPTARPTTAQGAQPTQPRPAQAQPQRPAPNYFQRIMQEIQGVFGTTGQPRSSAADNYFDAAMQADALGESDTAMALYAKALEADATPSPRGADGLDTLGSIVPGIISEYITAAMTPAPAQAAVAETQAQPAATQPTAAVTPAGRALAVGRVVDPSQDVFPSTGAHLDVRVVKDGQYVNPEQARSVLRNLYVGGKPLYTQQGESWNVSYPITSRFGPRSAPAPGASTYHRGIDLGVSAGTPLEWRGGGSFKPERGYGVITTTMQGVPYEIKLLHTTSS